MLDSKNPDSEILDRLLLDVTCCAAGAGFDIWLECGTLLGFVRDGDYIPWEDDLDFGVRITELRKDRVAIFKSAMEELGYTIKQDKSYWHIAISGSVCHADINIYTFSDDDVAIVPLMGVGRHVPALLVDTAIRIIDQRALGISSESTRTRDKCRIRLQRFSSWMPSVVRSMTTKMLQKLLEHLLVDVSWRVPKYLIAKSTIKEFRNATVLIPDKSEEYLAYRYGKDWQTPRQDYNTWKEDVAIVGDTPGAYESN